MSQVALAVREGLSAMVPLPILELMPPSQLELLVCGLPNIPVHALKKVARYRYALLHFIFNKVYVKH